MGTWGAGNFDNDCAGDHLAEMTHGLLDEVRRLMADEASLEPDEEGGTIVPCNLEVLALLAQQRWVGVALPAAAEAEGWKRTFMQVWEATIDGLGPDDAFKAERRAVLSATFDRLIETARRR